MTHFSYRHAYSFPDPFWHQSGRSTQFALRRFFGGLVVAHFRSAVRHKRPLYKPQQLVLSRIERETRWQKFHVITTTDSFWNKDLVTPNGQGGGATPQLKILENSNTAILRDAVFCIPSLISIWHPSVRILRWSVGKFLNYAHFCDMTRLRFRQKVLNIWKFVKKSFAGGWKWNNTESRIVGSSSKLLSDVEKFGLLMF